METAQEEVREVRIEGYPDYGIDTTGAVWSYKKGGRRKMLFDLIKSGYARLPLHNHGKCKRFSVHRLVAIAFIPNLENKPQVNHINGIKTDNRIENLEWATHSENMRHAHDVLGKVNAAGKDNSRSKIIIQMDIDGNIMSEFESTRDAKRKTGIPQSSICSAANNKSIYAGGFKWKYKEIA